MNYFVTIEGIEVKSNLKKEQAIKSGKLLSESHSNIGIGKRKFNHKGYTLLPLHFFI